MTTQLTDLVLEALSDLKAEDVCTLDVTHLTCVTDTMIVCTGTSSRHVQSIANHVVQEIKQQQFPIMGQESDAASEWVLIDLGDIILHVMLASTRSFYNIEKLWDIKPSDHA